MRWTVLLEQDARTGEYAVTVPGLPNVVSAGHTFEHALDMAREAIRLELADRIADGLDAGEDLYEVPPVVATVDVEVPSLDEARDILGDDWVPMIEDPNEELTLSVAGERFGVTPSALRQAIAAERLPARTAGRTYLVRAADVVRYMATRPGGAQRTYQRRPDPETTRDRQAAQRARNAARAEAVQQG